MNFVTGDMVVPVLSGPVDSSDGGGPSTQSSDGESSVLAVRNNRGKPLLVLKGRDGKPHTYEASLFEKRPVHAV